MPPERYLTCMSVDLEIIVRSREQQQAVDAATAGLQLYHYASCWFCAKVRRVIDELQLNIELRDILVEPENRQTLITHGGSSTVPCLRIEDNDGSVTWMYESTDICNYLSERFGQDS